MCHSDIKKISQSIPWNFTSKAMCNCIFPSIVLFGEQEANYLDLAIMTSNNLPNWLVLQCLGECLYFLYHVCVDQVYINVVWGFVLIYIYNNVGWFVFIYFYIYLCIRNISMQAYVCVQRALFLLCQCIFIQMQVDFSFSLFSCNMYRRNTSIQLYLGLGCFYVLEKGGAFK